MPDPLAQDGGGAEQRGGGYDPQDVVYNGRGEAFLWTEINGQVVPRRAPALDQRNPNALTTADRFGMAMEGARFGEGQRQFDLGYGLDQQQIALAFQQAAQGYQLALRSQNFEEAAYHQDRLDQLQAMHTRFQLDEQARAGERQFQAGQSELDRGFRSEESGLDRGFTAAENQRSRQFQGGESALDRAARATEFAATHGLNERQQGFQEGESLFQRGRQLRGDALDSAFGLADVISTTDPAALPAFMAAGGGVISNSLAAGADALSDNALLPGARALRVADANQAALNAARASYRDPGTAFASATGADDRGFGGHLKGSPEERAAQEAAWLRQTQGQTGAILTGNPVSVGGGTEVYNRLTAAANTPGSAIVQNGRHFSSSGSAAQNSGFTGAVKQSAARTPELEEMERRTGLRYAANGMDETVTSPTAIVAGEAGPEHVTVTPLGGNTNSLATDADTPFLRRARAIRQGVTIPSENPFSVGFRNVAPTIRELFFRGRQSAYGVPVQDQLAEANRFALSGVQRGGLRFTI